MLLEGIASDLNWTVLFNKSVYSLGVSEDYFHVLLISVALLAFIDRLKYRGINVTAAFFRQRWWFRALVEAGLLLFIILFGCYGSAYDVQQFIYFQF